MSNHFWQNYEREIDMDWLELIKMLRIKKISYTHSTTYLTDDGTYASTIDFWIPKTSKKVLIVELNEDCLVTVECFLSAYDSSKKRMQGKEVVEYLKTILEE